MIIQLQDEEKQNDLESLSVVLFDKDTVDVRNGEKAMIMGELYVVQQKGNSKRITYLFANGIHIAYAYSSTQGASGKSITAIIDKDNDSYVLRLGVLPQARNSVCILNEIASFSMENGIQTL